MFFIIIFPLIRNEILNTISVIEEKSKNVQNITWNTCYLALNSKLNLKHRQLYMHQTFIRNISLFSAIFHKQLYKGKIYKYMTNIRKTTRKIAFSILVYLVKGVTLKGSLQSGLSSTAALFSSDQGSLCISNDWEEDVEKAKNAPFLP